MSSVAVAMASPIDDNGVLFARLVLEDYGVLEEKIRTERRSLLRQRLDECNISGADRLAAFAQLDRHEVSVYDVDDYLQTYAGAKKALELSLRRQGKTEAEAAEVLKHYPFIEAVKLARELIGFEKRAAKKGDDKGEKSPLDNPATGSPSQPSSE